MVRSCHSRRRLARLFEVEKLEARFPLAADLDVAAPATSRIEWDGRLVDVARDAWLVRAASATATVSDFELPATWHARPLGEGFFVLSAPGAGVTGVLAWAGRTVTVATVEPDFTLGAAALPADPALDQLWGLRNVGQSGGTPGADIKTETAWNTTTGSRSVVVAVIDTGVDTTHPDLAANIWRNPREIPGDHRDNDGNGYVDDVNGWDFANGDADPMDDNGHGTHVAGTIGAVGGNGIGVVGVSWQVSIMPLKFMSGSGSGTTSSAIAAINYATMMRRDFGINVVATNNSWGGAANSLALRSAIAAGGNAGILFVAAAGNGASDNDAAPSYPASFADPSVIAVAASDRTNSLAGFSSFGATSVDVVAPGAGIYSTLPGGTYGWYSGTSMATPHVTGTIALLAAAAPRASANQIRAAILDGATPVATFAGRVATGGLLNAAGALERLGVATMPKPSVQPAPPAPAPIPVPVTPPAPAPVPPAAQPPRRETIDAGDTRATAMPVTTPARISARIGDGPAGDRDVDLYRVVLSAGQTLVADVDARTLPGSSTLDSYLRLFDASGREFARNDDTRGSLDSYLSFRAPLTGTYFIGVSGFPNVIYSSFLQPRKGGATGVYELSINILSPAGAAPTGLQTLGHRDDAPPVRGRDLVALAIDAEGRTAGSRHPRRR
ncbi:MAG: S8 family serine peptidase [Planctomycetia bacterium]